MTDHPNHEGERVAVDIVHTFGPHRDIETRIGTVAQVSETQPHIAWVDWDNGPRFQMIGTAHLRPETPTDREEGNIQ